MSEEFSLEARLDFIISGLTEALSQLDSAEAKINGVVTGLGDLAEKHQGAGKAAEQHAADLLDAQAAVQLLKMQVGELTSALNTEEAAVVRGSDEWSRRVQAINAAQRQYATFRKNELTGAETGEMLDINAQSGSEQRDNLATIAARKANYASEIAAASREIETAEQRIQAATAANDYDKEVAELGQVAAATRRYAEAEEALARAQRLDDGLQAADASLTTQARSRLALADAMDEQRAALRALRAAEAAERRAAAVPAESDTFFGISEGHLPRLRYAMYDVSFAAAVMGTALVGAFVGATAAAISFEADFAQVQRTVGITGEAAANLRKEFVWLSQTMPVSFADLSDIGTLGGQLNIAAGDLANFTRVTAQFAATTNVTIDASGTALGRLDQLLSGGIGAYEALASSILKVGVNSVATESQIIAISQNIAGIASTVGLTTDEVVGLAGAMASIGTAPEAARATLTRLFTGIQLALDSDSAALEKFGALVGSTAEQFRQAWKNDAGATLVTMLEGIDAAGDGAISTLQALGITSTRDVPTLLKLSQNTALLADALGLAEDGYSGAIELSSQYAVINETLSAKLQILGNSVMALFATIGNAADGPLNDIVDGLIGFIGLLADFAEKAENQPFLAFALAVTIGAGALALGAAGAARMTASLLATRTMIWEFTAAQKVANAATAEGVIAQTGSAAAGAADTASKRANTGATLGLATANAAATASTKALRVALIASGVGVAAVLVGVLAASLLEFSDSAEQAGRRAENYFGNFDSLTSALRTDNPDAFASSVDGVATSAEAAGQSTEDWSAQLSEAIRAQQEAQAAVDATADAIDGQTIKIGENTSAWLKNALFESPDLQGILKSTEGADALAALLDAGLDLRSFAEISATQGAEAGQGYVTSFFEGISARAAAGDESAAAIMEKLVGSSLDGADIGPKFLALAEEIANAYSAAQIEAAFDAAMGNEAAGESAEGAAAQYNELTGAIEGAGDASIAYSDQLSQQVENAMAGGVAAERLGQSVSSLGQAFSANGATVALSGSAMASVLQNISASSASGPEAAARMSTLFSAIVAGGYASTAQLSSLLATMSALTGAAVVANKSGASVNSMLAALRAGSAGAARGIGGAGGAAKSAANEIRTLVDYGNDLAGVFARMSDIRFGPQQALDAIASGWNALREEAEDAERAVEDAAEAIDEAARKAEKANATILGLTAERSNLEYWLNVAMMYDDAERVKQIQAELAENAADMADAQADLLDAQKDQAGAAQDMADAQDAASNTLSGNSDAALENRQALLDLLADYEKLIQTYAATGMPADKLKEKTEQLKAEFIAQAVALGFSEDAVMGYAASFGDMARAIDAVPRNITVGLDITGVDAAIAEFQAKLAAANSSGGGGGGGGGGGLDLSSLLGMLLPEEDRTIVFKGDTRLVGDALAELYDEVAEAEPMVSINGENVPALSALQQTIAAIQRGEGTVRINGEAVDADEALQKILRAINDSSGEVTINGETMGAGNALALLMGDIRNSKAEVTIGGTKQPAERVLATALDAIRNGQANVTIGGNRIPAQEALMQALLAINTSSASTTINADVTSASNSIARLLQRIANAEVYVNVGTTSPAGRVPGPGGRYYYASGGYTGPGGKYDEAGIVHRGEYVFPQEAVRYYGVENLAYMHQRAVRGYASGGPVGGPTPGATSGAGASFGSQMSAADRAFFTELFREFAGSLTITDGVIALAASAANQRLVKAGAK